LLLHRCTTGEHQLAAPPYTRTTSRFTDAPRRAAARRLADAPHRRTAHALPPLAHRARTT
jgi:hypothetical protein